MATIEGTAKILSDEPVQHGTALAIVPPSNLAVLPPVAPVQAETDEAMVLLWLDGLGPRTRRAYEADIRAFRHLVDKPLREIMLRDLQAYKAALAVVDEATGRPALASATQARRLSSVKSLLTAAHELGYLVLNIGSRVKLPPIKQTLAERILSDEDVREMLTLERNPGTRRCCACSTWAACASARRAASACGISSPAATPARSPSTARAARRAWCC